MAKRMGLGEAALKGAVASLVGGMATKLVWEAGQRTLPGPDRVHSPTAGAVEAMAERAGTSLTEAQTRAAAGAFYGQTMLAYGALYGIVQSRLHPPALGHGLLLAGIMYAANFPDFGLLPRLGVMPPPGEQGAREAAVPVAAQLAYGLTTAAVFDALS
ncbi:MAG TPA: hypothetical protein VGV85_02500 [Longimicrobiaceae bacterium]|nr:hypothetical protein [Longimicrobiaceae bacterium]